MNYLAHLFLAGEQPGLLLGNYLGDFVKGRVHLLDFEEDVKKGIMMHRRVDVLADQCIKDLLDAQTLHFEQRRYAGITFDLACDHFLAKYWQRFSAQTLQDFNHFCTHQLQAQQQLMPEKAVYVLDKLTRHQWLMRYKDIDYIEQVFYGIQQRLQRENLLQQAFTDFEKNYEHLELICCEFINNLMQTDFQEISQRQ